MRLLRLAMETSGDDPTEIRNRIEDLYAFSPDRRDLSSLVRSLPKSMWAAMGRWHGAGTGPGISITRPMAMDRLDRPGRPNMKTSEAGSLLERLRIALEDPTGRVKLMVVDEAWRYLKDPAVLS